MDTVMPQRAFADGFLTKNASGKRGNEEGAKKERRRRRRDSNGSSTILPCRLPPLPPPKSFFRHRRSSLLACREKTPSLLIVCGSEADQQVADRRRVWRAPREGSEHRAGHLPMRDVRPLRSSSLRLTALFSSSSTQGIDPCQAHERCLNLSSYVVLRCVTARAKSQSLASREVSRFKGVEFRMVSRLQVLRSLGFEFLLTAHTVS
ncbi:hypothetical protein ACQKWADRAFT_68104 [Trichoderma austrokoningii]